MQGQLSQKQICDIFYRIFCSGLPELIHTSNQNKTNLCVDYALVC